MSRRWLFILIQTAVTVGLLVFFFREPEFRAHVAQTLQNARPEWLLLGVALAGVENFLGVLRWRLFLRMLHIELPFWKSVQICLVALFCNTFLLGAAGGDFVRAAYLIRRGATKTDALMSVVLDRVSGLLALLLYTIVFAVLSYDWLAQSPIALTMLRGVLIYEVVCALLILAGLIFAARGHTERLPRWAPFPDFVKRFGHGFAQMAHQWPLSLRAAGLSMLMLLGYFGVFYAAAHAFGLPIPFVQMATLVPIVDVISALPISFGGVGVREFVFISLLGQLLGVSAGMAASISMAGFLLNSSWGLVGAAILPLFKGIVRDARKAADVNE